MAQLMGPPTILHVFPTFRVGGSQVRFARLANRLGREFRHFVIAMDGATDCRSRLADELDITFLPLPGGQDRFLARLKAYRRLLAELRPHLLVTSNWGTIEWAMADWDGHVRHLHMEDGFNPDERVSQFRRRIWTRRLFLRRATVLLPSQTLCAIAREVWRLPQERLVYVPNGIDCERFADSGDRALAASLGISGQVPVIGTVATLRAEKNLGRLLDAFALVKRRRPVQLVIVGEGAERQGLEAKAAALGIGPDVVFTGACPAPETILPFLLIFALSSDTEQMPLSVLEAMAAGRPVVATDVGDVKSMLASPNHPFVVAKDAGRLADALAALLDDASLREAIGAANRQRARESFDEDAMVSRYRALFAGDGPGDGSQPRS